jgi:hypothetical protein
MAPPNKKPAYVPAPPEEPVVTVKSAEVRIPTPPIGCTVQYFLAGETESIPHPAVVVSHCSHTGEVKVRNLSNVFQTFDGVRWSGDSTIPIDNDIRKKNGSWSVIPGTTIPDCWYDAHEKALAKKAARQAAREPAMAK